MATKKPTNKQVDLLKKYSIEPPPTRSSCHHLINFILKVKWKGMDSFQKAAYIKKVQWNWIGTKVMIDGIKPGKVTYLTIDYDLEDILMETDDPDEQPSSIFRFHVVSQDGEIKGLRAPYAIKRIEE